MTDTVLVRETRESHAERSGPRPRSESTPRRVFAACAALFALYVMLSFTTDPRATLGSDSAGKLATLEVMNTRGSVDPDIGYWAAELDPTGSLHPLYYTNRVGEKYVQVTTLPQLLAIAPLHDLGGARAALLVPMVGAVLAALAARALALRLHAEGGAGWPAFWAIGLTTPVALYALDVWEHALGLGLMAWGVVLLLDVAERRGGWKTAVATGALLGAAATMRTEALVVLLVAAGGACILTLVHRRAAAAICTGLAVVGGAAVPLLAGQVLERALIGSGIRGARAAGTAAGAGGGLRLRAEEAMTTLVGLNRFMTPTDWVLGGLVATCVAAGAWWLVRDRSPRRGALVLAAGSVLYVLLLADGIGFLPGLLTASPLAAAGVALMWSDVRFRFVGAVALVTVTLVWIAQYSGNARPQWGARYLLLPGFLLAVVAVTALASRPRALVALVALSALVTASGVAWLGERSTTIVDGMSALVARKDDAVVSLGAHLLREGGAFYDVDRHWLTATDRQELRQAFAVVGEAGDRTVAVIAARGDRLPATLGGYAQGATLPFELRPGEPLEIVEYQAG